MTHIRQSRTDSGFQIQVLTFSMFKSTSSQLAGSSPQVLADDDSGAVTREVVREARGPCWRVLSLKFGVWGVGCRVQGVTLWCSTYKTVNMAQMRQSRHIHGIYKSVKGRFWLSD
jgi:hypothetical protein